MNEHELYPIGDAARRSGLSVSAVPFYADAGIVELTALNQAGHRMYDIGAVAQLELVRTLREVDTDLTGIRHLPEVRDRMSDAFRQIPDLLRELAEEDAAFEAPTAGTCPRWN